MSNTKRKPGRPPGSTIDDSKALARIAEVMTANPQMTFNAASEQVLRAGDHRGHSDNAILARWRRKAAKLRAAAKDAAAKDAADRPQASQGGGGSIASRGLAGFRLSSLSKVNDPLYGAGLSATTRRMMDEQVRMQRLLDPDPYGITRATQRVLDDMRRAEEMNQQLRRMNEMDAALAGRPYI